MIVITVDKFLKEFNSHFNTYLNTKIIFEKMKKRDELIYDYQSTIDYDYHMDYFKNLYKSEVKKIEEPELKPPTKKINKKDSEIKSLKTEIENKNKEIEALKAELELLKNKTDKNIHNQRGAGRKTVKIDSIEKNKIIENFNEKKMNKSQLAREYNVSVTHISDIIRKGLIII